MKVQVRAELVVRDPIGQGIFGQNEFGEFPL